MKIDYQQDNVCSRNLTKIRINQTKTKLFRMLIWNFSVKNLLKYCKRIRKIKSENSKNEQDHEQHTAFTNNGKYNSRNDRSRSRGDISLYDNLVGIHEAGKTQGLFLDIGKKLLPLIILLNTVRKSKLSSKARESLNKQFLFTSHFFGMISTPI